MFIIRIIVDHMVLIIVLVCTRLWCVAVSCGLVRSGEDCDDNEVDCVRVDQMPAWRH